MSNLKATLPRMKQEEFFQLPPVMGLIDYIELLKKIKNYCLWVMHPFGGSISSMASEEFRQTNASFLQTAIDVVSHYVYEEAGDINECILTLSTYQHIEIDRNREAQRHLTEMQALLKEIHALPTFIELPMNMSLDHQDLFTEIVRMSSMMELPLEEAETTESQAFDVESQPIYSSVFYTLGFLPAQATFKTNARSLAMRKTSKSRVKAQLQAIMTYLKANPEMAKLESTQFLCATEIFQQEAQKRATEGDTKATEELELLEKVRGRFNLSDTTSFRCKEVEELVEAEKFKQFHEWDRSIACILQAMNNYSLLNPQHQRIRLQCLLDLARVYAAQDKDKTAIAYLDQLMASVHHSETKDYDILANVYQLYSSIYERTTKKVGLSLKSMVYALGFAMQCQHGEEDEKLVVALSGEIERIAKLFAAVNGREAFEERGKKFEAFPEPWVIQSYFASFAEKLEDKDSTTCACKGDKPEESIDSSYHRICVLKREGEYEACFKLLVELVAIVEALEADVIQVRKETCAKIYNLYSCFLYLMGDLKAALEAISESIEYDSSVSNSFVRKGVFLSEYDSLDLALALECFDTAFQLQQHLDKSSPDALADIFLHRGQIALMNDHIDEAIEDFQESLKHNREHGPTNMSYGMALAKAGSLLRAEGIFKDQLERRSSTVDALRMEMHLFYGDICVEKGNNADAMKQFESAALLGPSCPLPYLHAGRAFMKMQNIPLALMHFRQAIQIDSTCSMAYLDLGQLYFAKGLTRDAFAAFDQALATGRYMMEYQEAYSCYQVSRYQLELKDEWEIDLRQFV